MRNGQHVVADSRAALRLLETASPPTFYLPADDVDLAYLLPDGARSSCEWKGVAHYFTLRGAAGRGVVAWEYPRPAPAYAGLASHVAFYPGRIACCVDDERVQPQPGGFYGGWITSELAGPFKGEPGTGHQWRFDREKIKDWIDNRANGSPPPVGNRGLLPHLAGQVV